MLIAISMTMESRMRKMSTLKCIKKKMTMMMTETYFQRHKPPKRRQNQRSKYQIAANFLIIAATVDEKEVKAIFDQFLAFFTIDQVKNTLVANKGDKVKTISDLKFKQGNITCV